MQPLPNGTYGTSQAAAHLRLAHSRKRSLEAPAFPPLREQTDFCVRIFGRTTQCRQSSTISPFVHEFSYTDCVRQCEENQQQWYSIRNFENSTAPSRSFRTSSARLALLIPYFFPFGSVRFCFIPFRSAPLRSALLRSVPCRFHFSFCFIILFLIESSIGTRRCRLLPYSTLSPSLSPLSTHCSM